jgi:hypothetical protein
MMQRQIAIPAHFAASLRTLLSSDGDVLRQGLESISIRLDHGNRDVPGLAGVDVPNNSGFAFMDTADYLAFRAVLEIGC